jgi:hypothetical protein
MGACDVGAQAGQVAAVALANKTARIAWAVMMRGSGYQAKQVLGQTA